MRPRTQKPDWHLGGEQEGTHPSSTVAASSDTSVLSISGLALGLYDLLGERRGNWLVVGDVHGEHASAAGEIAQF